MGLLTFKKITMKKFAYFISMIALTIVFTTACGNRTSNSVDSIETSDFYKQKGWLKMNDQYRNRVFIISDNYHMINNLPVILQFTVMEWMESDGMKQMAYLLLADASKTDNPRNPSFDERMTSVSLMLDGENIILNTERPMGNSVNIADDKAAVDLLHKLMVTKKTTVTVTLNNGDELTYTFNTYNNVQN